nr:replication factor A protein 1-like [Ipomoea batatas]
MNQAGSWDEDIINDLFEPSDVSRILATPVSPDSHDVWRWQACKWLFVQSDCEGDNLRSSKALANMVCQERCDLEGADNTAGGNSSEAVWIPPPPGRVKCNVDAALYGDDAGFGLILSSLRFLALRPSPLAKAGEFWIGGEIVAIENSYNWFVVCCQANDCNSQLIPLPSGEYECKKCLTNCSKGIDKYNLKLQVEDANGNAKLKLVDKDCMQLIGKTASDLRAKHRRITPQLPKEIQSLVGLGMLFMVEVKREQLENRYAPFSVTKIINDQTLVSLYCPEVIKKLVS